MPRKPKKPCACHGCRELTAGRYCEGHAKEEAKRYNKYDRDPKTNKRYGRAWKQIRATFIAANPLCEICRESGQLTPADTIHHRKKLSDGGTHEYDNLQALCKECHSRLHTSHGDYF